MNAVTLNTDMDSMTAEERWWQTGDQIEVHDGVHLVRVPKGTESGASTVALVFKLPDGKPVWVEMTMNNFQLAAVAFKAADERDQDVTAEGKKHAQEKLKYERLYEQNTKYSGSGLNTTIHMPCPFCAAPDFESHKIMDTHEAIQKEHVCGKCKRGAKGVVTNTPLGLQVQLYQTRGDDPPSHAVRLPRWKDRAEPERN